SQRAALLRQIAPGKARDAGNGCSLAKSRNAAWHNLPRNPQGRACFCALLRFSSLIWNNQTTLLVPGPAQKQAPSRPRRNVNRPYTEKQISTGATACSP
ncbi:hypothetical protein, partial [Pseudomonas sp.]|uniref:hypothetical protein n=1 Tax=Pseudomonas sp. TaxID=306 RepID=UPI0027364894